MNKIKLFYRISVQPLREVVPAKKKAIKKKKKLYEKGVNPLLMGMHYLPLPALLVHVRPKVPEHLAEEELMQWDLKRKGP